MLKAVVNSPVRSGNQTINNGDLVINTAGQGVDFSANTHAAGMTSEKLTWYEEGTFTPIIAGATTPGTQTYVVQVGRYTRIGNRVLFNLRIVLSAKDVTTAGTLYVGGLPFAANSTSSNFSACAVSSTGFIDLSAGYSQIVADVQPSDTKIYLGQVGDNIASSLLTDAAFFDNTRIVVAGHYEV